jgi:tRNA U38,U39,U40 pseudouridine synthase TruA
MSTGIKKILRRADDNDEPDDVDKFLDRDMSHISEEMLTKIYATRMSLEQKAELQKHWKSYIGTHKYHNYTKDVKSHMMAA